MIISRVVSGPLFAVREISCLTKTFCIIPCFLFCRDKADCAPVHKARCIKDGFNVVEVDWPAQNLSFNTFGMTWNGPWEPASEFHLTNVFLDKWAKIPTDTFQNPVESLPRKGKTVIHVTG